MQFRHLSESSQETAIEELEFNDLLDTYDKTRGEIEEELDNDEFDFSEDGFIIEEE